MMEARLPAEWESHEATWLAWPSNTETWTLEDMQGVQLEFAAFVTEISKGEKVFLLIQSFQYKDIVLSYLKDLEPVIENVIFIEYLFNDSWIRDFGPDFLVGETLTVLNWKYNAWGGKYPPFKNDDAFNNWLALEKGLDIENIDFILEGGSFELNGAGDLITTESCLLNPNRNPDFSKSEIELLLKNKLKVQNVIWLKEGLTGDDTDGHIDDMFRFISRTKVVGVCIKDKSHPDFSRIEENRNILKETNLLGGAHIELIDLPEAPILRYDGEQLPASYANFYISNHSVIVPQFGHENDALAINVLKEHFEGRRVIGLSSKSIIIGLGSFHCLSKQQPMIRY